MVRKFSGKNSNPFQTWPLLNTEIAIFFKVSGRICIHAYRLIEKEYRTFGYEAMIHTGCFGFDC